MLFVVRWRMPQRAPPGLDPLNIKKKLCTCICVCACASRVRMYFLLRYERNIDFVCNHGSLSFIRVCYCLYCICKIGAFLNRCILCLIDLNQVIAFIYQNADYIFGIIKFLFLSLRRY